MGVNTAQSLPSEGVVHGVNFQFSLYIYEAILWRQLQVGNFLYNKLKRYGIRKIEITYYAYTM